MRVDSELEKHKLISLQHARGHSIPYSFAPKVNDAFVHHLPEGR